MLPRRIVARKRLSEILKAAKEKKIEEEKKEEPYMFDTKYLYPLAGLTIAGLSLYWSYKQNQKEEEVRTVDIKK